MQSENSIGPSNGLVSSHIDSVTGKKWGVRRKRGDSTAPTDTNGMYANSRTCFFWPNTILKI